MPKEVPAAIKHRSVIGQGLYALGALLCVVNTYLSIAFIVLCNSTINRATFHAASSRLIRRPVERLERWRKLLRH